MEQKMVTLTINDIPVTVPEGTTVLEAARSAGIKIPSLCFLKDVNEIGVLPHLRGGGQGGPEPDGLLRLPGERGHGGLHQHGAGTPLPPADPGADPLQPPDGLPHLLPQQPL